MTGTGEAFRRLLFCNVDRKGTKPALGSGKKGAEAGAEAGGGERGVVGGDGAGAGGGGAGLRSCGIGGNFAEGGSYGGGVAGWNGPAATVKDGGDVTDGAREDGNLHGHRFVDLAGHLGGCHEADAERDGEDIGESEVFRHVGMGDGAGAMDAAAVGGVADENVGAFVSGAGNQKVPVVGLPRRLGATTT